MALVDFDVVAADVLEWMLQVSPGNANRPGTAAITSRFIPSAAADINDVLLEAGLSASSVSSVTTPIAWRQMHDLVARHAALLYSQSLGITITEGSSAERMYQAVQAQIDSILAGRRVGELSNTTGPMGTRLHIGDDDSDSIDARRATMGDAL